MKILIIGANGTIGKKVAQALSSKHEIFTAGRTSGDIQMDITSAQSIEAGFKQMGSLDACICTAGTGYYGKLDTMTEENVYSGIRNKLMGQINVVLIGQHYLNDNGSITLTSGILSEEPVRNSSCVAMLNGGINSFVLAASLELTRGIRINVVSPGLVEDSVERYGASFPGIDPVPMNKVVNAYIRSTEGAITGKILKVYA